MRQITRLSDCVSQYVRGWVLRCPGCGDLFIAPENARYCSS